MDTQKKVLIGVGTAAVAAGGFVAFRLYVRAETKKALIADYRFDEVFEFIENVEDATGKDLNMPSYEEFVTALVPIGSLTMPKDAIADVFKNGRDSRFWSAEHTKPVNREIESYVFKALRAAYETPEDATLTEMLAASTLAVVQALALRKKGK